MKSETDIEPDIRKERQGVSSTSEVSSLWAIKARLLFPGFLYLRACVQRKSLLYNGLQHAEHYE